MFHVELGIRIPLSSSWSPCILLRPRSFPARSLQGRAVETLEIARDVARNPIEAHQERGTSSRLSSALNKQDFTIVVAA